MPQSMQPLNQPVSGQQQLTGSMGSITTVASHAAIAATQQQVLGPLAVSQPGQVPARCRPVVWRPFYTVGVIVFIVLLVAAGLGVPLLPQWFGWPATAVPVARLVAAAVIVLGVSAILGLVGKGITGLGQGILVDSRNFFSLSRLQMIMWTVLVLSAWLAIVFSNYALGYGRNDNSAINVGIPVEIWGAMGISIASLLGSPLLLSAKRSKPADESDTGDTLQALDPNATGDVGHSGQVLNRACPDGASIADLFRGDETSNGDHVDLGKVQMFLFTLVLLVGYAVSISMKILGTAGPIDALPSISPSFIALMALSHAGYLGNKAIPRGQTPQGASTATKPNS